MPRRRLVSGDAVRDTGREASKEAAGAHVRGAEPQLTLGALSPSIGLPPVRDHSSVGLPARHADNRLRGSQQRSVHFRLITMPGALITAVHDPAGH